MTSLIKPITSDHDLIELAEKKDVRLDNIFESSEIASHLPKNGSFLILLRQPNVDVGHWIAVHNGEYFDSMGEAAPTKYGIGRYDSKQYQGTYGDYCGPFCILWLFKRRTIAQAHQAFKNGKLSLTANELKGSGSIIYLHPASYEKAIKARKAGRGVRLDITRHEVKKVIRELKEVAFGPRAAIRSMTGVGIYDSDSDVEKDGGRITVADVKKGAKRALSYAKRKGVLTDGVDAAEKFLLSKATKPEHEILIKSIRGEVKRRYGVGVAKSERPAKGSQEAKDRMAAVRAKRRGGSFRL
ncbi:unnamed protein product [Phytophthora lilii]|uniref:Unnamed protein product n=1 Tax=Phytophthora lilii TaxID=2077276 RepID=A0A9W6WMH8_9STRA|nr:unnamed protein product [Phytophthora lilii]